MNNRRALNMNIVSQIQGDQGVVNRESPIRKQSQPTQQRQKEPSPKPTSRLWSPRKTEAIIPSRKTMIGEIFSGGMGVSVPQKSELGVQAPKLGQSGMRVDTNNLQTTSLLKQSKSEFFGTGIKIVDQNCLQTYR